MVANVEIATSMVSIRASTEEAVRHPKLQQLHIWSRRQESNLYLPLRRRPFYPLNYGEQGPAARAFYESFLKPIVGRTSVAEIAS